MSGVINYGQTVRVDMSTPWEPWTEDGSFVSSGSRLSGPIQPGAMLDATFPSMPRRSFVYDGMMENRSTGGKLLRVPMTHGLVQLNWPGYSVSWMTII